MISDNVAKVFADVPDEQMCLFLSLLAMDITIRARSVYDNQELSNQSRAFNEILHRLSGQLVALMSKKAKGDRYPDEVFVRILADNAVSGDVGLDFERAVKWAYARIEQS